MANLGFKTRKWEIFCRLFSIFLKTSIGSCKNYHLGRLLIKSGYTLDMKHKSLITLSAYILKTKCRNLAIFSFFLTLKKQFIFEFWVFISFFGKIMPIKKKGLDTWDLLSLPEQSSCWWFLSYMVIFSLMWSLPTLSYQTFMSFSSTSCVEFEPQFFDCARLVGSV